MNAIALFCKDKVEIFKKMSEKIAEVLSKKSEVFCEQIAREFDLTPAQVKQLKSGTKTVDFALFDRLKGALEIPIQDVLGSPHFTPQTRHYWEKQCQFESPMFFAAPSLEEGGAGCKGHIPDEERKRIELDLYVRLRAIDELAWDK